MKVIKYVNLLIGFFIVAGCASKQEIELFHQLDENRTKGVDKEVAVSYVSHKYREYFFKPKDRILVTVFDYPELQMPQSGVMIDSRGYAPIPLIGRIKVAGLSEEAAARKIERLFKKYRNDIVVNVENPNKEIYIIGEVNKPGPLKLVTGRKALLKAIASAGGFRDSANKDVVYIVKKYGDEVRLQRVSLTGKNSLKNSYIYLTTGDIVYVAPNSIKMINMGPMQTLKIIEGAMAPVGVIRSF